MGKYDKIFTTTCEKIISEEKIINEGEIIRRRINGNFKEELQAAIDDPDQIVTVCMNEDGKIFEEEFRPREWVDDHTIKGYIWMQYSKDYPETFDINNMISKEEYERLKSQSPDMLGNDPSVCKDWGCINALEKGAGFNEAYKKHEELCKKYPKHHRMDEYRDNYGHDEHQCRCGFKYNVNTSG